MRFRPSNGARLRRGFSLKPFVRVRAFQAPSAGFTCSAVYIRRLYDFARPVEWLEDAVELLLTRYT